MDGTCTPTWMTGIDRRTHMQVATPRRNALDVKQSAPIVLLRGGRRRDQTIQVSI